MILPRRVATDFVGLASSILLSNDMIIIPRLESKSNNDSSFSEEKKDYNRDIESGKVKLLSQEQADEQMEAFLREL